MTTDTRAGGPVTDPALGICIRIPKSGSASLSACLQSAYAGRRVYYLPNTLDHDGRVSLVQRVRFRRTQMRNLFRHHGTVSLGRALEIIGRECRDGDLIDGGHIDLPSVSRAFVRPPKAISLLRRPEDRIVSEYRYARLSYEQRDPLRRRYMAIRPRVAGRYSFDGYVSFLYENRGIYGDIAAQYLGWDGTGDPRAYIGSIALCIGTLEEADRFAAALSGLLGKTAVLRRLNATSGDEGICVSNETRRLIEAAYARDIALYEAVREAGCIAAR